MGSKILIVGCGGLGCELVKLLAADPSNDITIVDDDTIDSTNLNRQFFFVKSDVSRSKSEVVAEKIMKNENHPNIKHIFDKIDVYKKLEFYKGFNVVYNCLDNDNARSFVSQRCFLANVRLIDGGSAGWLGQSFCNTEECFDCIPKQGEKVYPVCSVRQKPKNFEHCLIWAKAVADKSFDLPEELEMLMECNEELSNSSESEIFKDIKSESEESDLMVIENAKKDIELPAKKFKKSTFEFNKDIFMSELENIEDLIERIFKLASLKAKKYGIQPFSLLETQTFIKKIIPSICTTNSIIASLMVLSESKLKNFYLVQGSLGLIKVDPTKKRKDCLVCSLPTYKATITENTTCSSFLASFNGETLINGVSVYNSDCNELLAPFDGDIMICMRNGFPNRIYFEIDSAESIKRIK